MSISAFDSRIFRNLFSTQKIRDVFTDEAYVRRMIDVELALARAQSAVAIIPKNVGTEITAASENFRIDFDRLARETDIVGYPVLPLVRQMVEATPDPEVAKYIHWGATTQDIMDDASMLQMKAGLALVKKELQELITTLSRLANSHRDT